MTHDACSGEKGGALEPYGSPISTPVMYTGVVTRGPEGGQARGRAVEVLVDKSADSVLVIDRRDRC
eukprot:scaffold39831_cov58-Phaeocystis_antarctica.AAC.5